MAPVQNATETLTTNAAPRGNNYRHGFRTSFHLRPNDPHSPQAGSEYRGILAELLDHHRPANLTEERLVREMAEAEYQLRRVREQMYKALDAETYGVRLKLVADGICRDEASIDPIAAEAKAIENMAETRCSWGTWQRYESKYENQYDKAWRNLLRWREAASRAEVRRSRTQPSTAPVPEPVSNVQNAPVQQHAAPGSEPADSRIPRSAALTPRSAPCPCGSGDKYKRCCGKTAPPVLSRAA